MPSPFSDTTPLIDSRPQALVRLPVNAQQIRVRGAGQHLYLDFAPLLVGRDHRCSLTLLSHTASRFHCVLYRQGAQAYVRDLRSTNGVLLNGQPVLHPAPLQAGDQLEMGGSVFEIEDGAPCQQRPQTQGVVLHVSLELPPEGCSQRQQALFEHRSFLLESLENRVLWHFGQILERSPHSLSSVFGLWPHADPHYDLAAEALETALAMIEESGMPHFPELRAHLGLVAGSLSTETLALSEAVAKSNALYETSLLMNDALFQQLEQQKGGREVDWVRFSPQAPPVSLYTWDERLVRSRQFLFSGWYQMGLAAYRQGQWHEAEAFFEQGEQAGDALSRLMLRRLQILKTQPPVNWDGIWELGQEVKGAF
ncbi:MAG: FHA domain-containing protein [Candidatus Sericytochromatia bacterium]